MRIRPFEVGDAPACEGLLRSLPEWFGIEAALVQYCRDLQALETYVVPAGDGVAALVTLKRHNRFAGEIHLVAVQRARHRQGTGRGLVRHVEGILRREGAEYLQVKTLGPSKPDGRYEGTRRFYAALGFRPLEETGLWGPENPCLIMVKHLGCPAGP